MKNNKINEYNNIYDISSCHSQKTLVCIKNDKINVGYLISIKTINC